jgi:fluoride exporter
MSREERSMTRLLLVGAGGFVGTCCRYLLSGWLAKAVGPDFPYGTLAVNLIGSFAIGVLMWIGVNTAALGPDSRLALTTGVLGGFTTYSAFNFETLQLLQARAWRVAALYVGLTLLGCLLVGWLGWSGAAWLGGRAHNE